MPKNTQDEFHGQQAREHDETYDVKKVMPYGWNAAGAIPFSVNPDGSMKENDLALRWVISGNFVYLGEAEPGSAQTGAVWRIQRIETTTGTILYADGDADFDNVWDDYSTLTYS